MTDQTELDVVIAGGKVIDGSGSAACTADVGVRNGVIVTVESGLSERPSERRVDADGKIVCPGFIDTHTHAGRGLRSDNRRRRAAPNMVMDGVTTAALNLDGLGAWPIRRQIRDLAGLGIGLNAVPFVPHNVIRRRALGEDATRPASSYEIEEMQSLVRKGMDEGAWGLAVGLEYIPGIWSTTDELIALTAELVPYGGVYSSHQRCEGLTPLWYRPSDEVTTPPTVFDAVKETIEVGERTGARVVATHLKLKSPVWGRADEIIRLIEQARARGVDVWADQYSYETSGSDGSVVLIPKWARQGDESPVNQVQRFADDPSSASMLRADIEHEIHKRGGPERITVMAYADATLVGRSLADIAAERDVTPVDLAVLLQLEGDPDLPGGARLRGFSLREDDVDAIMRMPWTACASDGRIMRPDDDPFSHPRRYGNFARRLGHYARDRGVISLEFAVHSATGLPAEILGLTDRGLVQPGYAADIVIFDPERIRDQATVDDPHRYSEGIEHVLVNGIPVVSDEQPTWELPGSPLARASGDAS